MALHAWFDVIAKTAGIAGFCGSLVTLWLWHRHAVKLERLRSHLRDIEARSDSIRSAAMDALAVNHTALSERRFKAVDALWKATMASKACSAAVEIVGRLKLEEIGEPTPEIRLFAKGLEPLLSSPTERKGPACDALLARPFVSPMAWALYAAYDSIIVQAVIQFKAIQSGVDPMKNVKTATTLDLVRAVLPEHDELLEKLKEAAYPRLLPQIEERLLSELRKTACGHGWDEESVERARRVLALIPEATIPTDRRKGI